MRDLLVPARLEVLSAAAFPGAPEARATGVFDGTAGSFTAGPLEVVLAPGEPLGDAADRRLLRWSVANRSDVALRVRSVWLVFTVAAVADPVRLFAHGYQSWSPSGVVTLGLATDPSSVADFEFMQGAYHADQRTVAAGELRSEWVTLIAGAGNSADVLVGFDGGDRHDGIFRLRRAAAGTELVAEAFLGDAVLAAGEARELHGLLFDYSSAPGSAKLAQWAEHVGAHNRARVDAPYQVGWCSWYQYFHAVNEDDLRENLARARGWPFDVFQLDDGYQAAIGDWLATNAKFASSLDAIAAAIAAEGRRPGIWLAPFLVAPDSEVARRHPSWLVRYLHQGEDHGPLRAWWNEQWGGGDAGFMHALDTTNPEVLEHLAGVAASLVDAGFSYLKLDFTFAPSIDGGYHDPALTPAQRVRAGFDAVRRGAGDDTFLLGCGVPLANVVGVVDGARIGQDVAPLWSLRPGDEVVPGYLTVEPATSHAHASTLARAFLHRRMWLNDPDCVMLRTTGTHLSPEAASAWARTVGISGGMVLVSDDLALLGDRERALLDEVIEVGRACDVAALAGRGAACADLLDHNPPELLECDGRVVAVDPATGTLRS